MLRNVMAIDNGKIIGIPSAASGVSYDNTDSGLSSTNVQDAIDEVCDDLSDKVDKVTGKGLSTNDYTNADKGIVDGVTSALAGKVDTSSVGSANGVAELDANGRVPSSQLPSYVDDVLEYADLAHFPATGETGKIYIAEDTNKTYRWSGSDYAEISESLALGETSSTAYAGNKGKANADAIAAMKDGTNIDSFGDVETALSGKANSSDLGDKSNLTTTDKSSAVAAINELKSGLTNIGNDTDLGNVQGSDTITLSDSVSNYRFIQVLIGYYGSGYPCFGQVLLPVSTLAISAEDIPTTVAFSDRNATNSGHVDISFLSATSVKVVNTSSTIYTKLVGII